MKLADLEPKFLMHFDDYDQHVSSPREADGIQFLCPTCYVANGNSSAGTHHCLCWFRDRVPDDLSPGPGRWTPRGTGIADLTFVPGDPPIATSVRITSGCMAHFYIDNGEVRPA